MPTRVGPLKYAKMVNALAYYGEELIKGVKVLLHIPEKLPKIASVVVSLHKLAKSSSKTEIVGIN